MPRRKKKPDKKEDSPEFALLADADRLVTNDPIDFQQSFSSAPAQNPDGSSKRARLDSSPSDVPHQRAVPTPSAVKSSAPPTSRAPHTPNVKPCLLGEHVYTPFTMLRDKESVNVIGIVLSAGAARKLAGGDTNITHLVADASCIEGTGSARQISRGQSLVFFHREPESIPLVETGQVLAVRQLWSQTFQDKPQLVAKAYNRLVSWSVYDPVKDIVTSSPNMPQDTQITEEEMAHYRGLAKWFKDLDGGESSAVVPCRRPMVTLNKAEPNLFFDTVVEVVKSPQIVYGTPVLYVTDYTQNPLFDRGNDQYLRSIGRLNYPEEDDGSGYVCQIGVWDKFSDLTRAIAIGDIICLRNVRAKYNQFGMLEGNIGHGSDTGIKMNVLDSTDPERILLQRRKAKFFVALFEPKTTEGSKLVEEEEETEESKSQVLSHVQLRSSEDRQATRSDPSTPTSRVMSPAVVTDLVKTESPALALSAANTFVHSFPTPAQRPLQVVQNIARRDASVQTDANMNSYQAMQLPTSNPIAPLPAKEPRPLICCKAPSSEPMTSLVDLQTTAACPGAYKVRGRILSTEPTKVKDWARLECATCNRLLPLAQRFCTKCGDEDGNSLSHCLRFGLIVQETEQEKRLRLDLAEDAEPVTMKVLFHGKSAEALLPFVNAKQLFQGESRPIAQLKRFRDQMLYPTLYNRQTETTLAIHSFMVNEAGQRNRHFAAFKQSHMLHRSYDPN